MSLNGADTIFRDAVRHFWRTRTSQAQGLAARGRTDAGARSAATGGKQMDGFRDALCACIEQAGIGREHIHVGRGAVILPGYYRPEKQWDIVVVKDGEFLAAIELKSQAGPSFGNNFNNRTEEAMGSALDIWTAYRERAFSTSSRPWLGYLFLLEDHPKSRSEVRTSEPHFPVFPEFRNASYAKRYEEFCRRLVLERQYNAACFLISSQAAMDMETNYAQPGPDLSGARFIGELARHLSGR